MATSDRKEENVTFDFGKNYCYSTVGFASLITITQQDKHWLVKASPEIYEAMNARKPITVKATRS